jgi:CHAD domain-containing protein
LAPILGIRSLIPLLSRSTQTDTIRVLDDEVKTVLRLIIEQHVCTSDGNEVALPMQVHLKPVRGYSKAAVKMHKWLLQHGLRPAPEHSVVQALRVAGQSPDNYIAKPQIQFDPSMPSEQAVRQLLRFLLDVMQRNKAGILQDIDSEFLHDFRVAIRRTRSALGQLKGIFPADVTQRFRQHLARLAAMTSPQRDLDVYLLQQDAYKAKLPDHLRADIEPLFVDLQRQRNRAHTAIKRQFQGKTVTTILDTWAAFLHAPNRRSDTAPHAATPIATLAQKRLRKKCRTVVALGQKLSQCPNDEQLHALRIECKKLRYLLEFFTSLFPTSQIDPLLKQLRKLQNNLGDFNDICVQQRALHEMAKRFDAPAQRPTLRAIDCLIGLLDLDKQARRDAFAKRFTSFAKSVKRVGRLKTIR